jgi:ADP-ribose pyrophosphatase
MNPFYCNIVYVVLHTFIICFLSSFSQVEAGDNSRKEYNELIKLHPNLIPYSGNHLNGEIEIIVDPSNMAEIEQKTKIDVGVIAKNKWGWLWLNDACKFPDGHEGVFGRILSTKQLEPVQGVGVMPITPEGKIILINNFRHATRSWEIELPRGLVEFG